jgi:hypothetical protein
MADEFEKCLGSVIQPKYDEQYQLVLREFECKQGIPDFVIASFDEALTRQKKRLLRELGSIGSGAVPLILALLETDDATREQLRTRTGMNTRTIDSCLSKLIAMELVETRGEFLTLTGNWKMPDVRFHAFELKLENWKRALFQSCQSQAFASTTTAVFPLHKKQSIAAQLNHFRQMNVGVVFFDSETWQFEVAVKPEPQKPASRVHQIFALLKMTARVVK